MFKVKNDSKYHWTNHVIRKMVYYGLSPDRIKRVIRAPNRVEEGIAPNTIGVMQPRKIASQSRGVPSKIASQSRGVPSKIASQSRGKSDARKAEEIWVMYQKKPRSSQKIIISAWRYPGVSPVGNQIPIPEDILEELKGEGLTFN